jgi:hypothetical protein
MELQKPKWTLERLIENAKKYPSKYDWRVNEVSAYQIASSQKLLATIYKTLGWGLVRPRGPSKKQKRS